MENAKDLRVGDEAHGHFLVTFARNDTTKNGKPYVVFDCRARDGTIFSGCKIWDCRDRPEGVIEIKGPLDEFNGQVHIIAKKWKPTQIDPNEFEPRAPWPLDLKEMYNRLGRAFEYITNKQHQSFIKDYLAFWSSHKFLSLARINKRFMSHPGAIKVHHSYRHGLLEHTLEVTEHAIAISKLHQVNERELDLLVIGCLIHDLGKMEEFAAKDGVYDYTLTGKAYGWSSNAHLYIGGQMLLQYYTRAPNTYILPEEDFFVLQNIVMSHHGDFGDVKPKYIVSMIAHIADMASSQANRMRIGLATTDESEVPRDVVRESYLRLTNYDNVAVPRPKTEPDPECDETEDSLTPPEEQSAPELTLGYNSRSSDDILHNEDTSPALSPPDSR